MSGERTIRDVLANAIGYTPPTDGLIGSCLSKMVAEERAVRIARALGLDPDTVLDRDCETCEGKGIKQYPPPILGVGCRSCNGSGRQAVNRIIVESAMWEAWDVRKALHIGRAVLASRRGGSGDDQAVQDFMAYLLEAGWDQ